jgi:hypothetical protein
MTFTVMRGLFKTAVIGAALTISSLLPALVVLSNKAYASGEQAVVGMPFAGTWAWNTTNVTPPYTDNNSSHPSVHAKYYGDWATDVYAKAGTAVKLNVKANGTITFTKNRDNDTCSSYGANVAGRGIALNVLVNNVMVGSV